MVVGIMGTTTYTAVSSEETNAAGAGIENIATVMNSLNNLACFYFVTCICLAFNEYCGYESRETCKTLLNANGVEQGLFLNLSNVFLGQLSTG